MTTKQEDIADSVRRGQIFEKELSRICLREYQSTLLTQTRQICIIF